MRTILSFIILVSLSACGDKLNLDGPLSLIAAQNTVTIGWSSQNQIRQDSTFSMNPDYQGSDMSYEKVSGPAWASIDSSSGIISGIAKETSSTIRVRAFSSSKQGVFDVTITATGDPLKSQQWHLENTAQKSFTQNAGVAGSDLNLGLLPSQGIVGTGVRIAVSDSGVQTTHPDLSSNMLTGEHRDYTLSVPPFLGDPVPPLADSENAHGSAVSGIIAAEGWNNIGVRGVAPSARIAGFKFIGFGVSGDSIKRDHQATGTFDIFNYSYGTVQYFYAPMPQGYAETLRNSTSTGRGGKGSIFIKSAGNEFFGFYSDIIPNYVGPSSYFLGNANLDGNNNTPYTMIVASNNADDVSASYSSPGANNWVSAPGGQYGTESPAIVTTDFVGCMNGKSRTSATANDFEKGVNPLNSNCDYTSIMNGTSSAAPNTSGVVALMLQANPNLTWRDVKHILASTARKIDPTMSGSNHPGSANLPGHLYQDGWINNAAGFHFHNWYGFGAVDATAAITMALSYSTNLGGFLSNDGDLNSWMYSSGNVNLPIPDYSASGAVSQISLNHNYIIEAVQIKINATHVRPGELGVELTSPSGTKSQLLNINSFIDETNLTEMVLLSNAFYGEQSNGNWTLKVIDGKSGNAGSLNSWQIRVFGRTPTVLGDSNPPNPVPSVTHASSLNSSSQSPPINWTQSSSNDVIRYEYSLGTAPGLTNVKNWTSAGLSTSVTVSGLSLSLNTQYFVNVRAFDLSENVSAITSSSGWFYTNSGPPTMVFGTPDKTLMNSTGVASVVLTFTGAGTVPLNQSYISLLPTGGVSCSASVSGTGTSSRTIQLSSCTGNGSIQFNVAAGALLSPFGVSSLQAGPSAAVSIDNTAPGITGLSSFPAPAISRNFSWTCSENPCQYRFVIDQSPSTSPQGTYSLGSSAFIGGGQSGTYYLHVQARDTAGNESAVSHVSAVIDNVAPNITGLSDDSVWKKTKTWSWGCDKASCTYRTLVDTNPTSSPVSAYSTNNSITQSTGTGTYYLHIQAQDAVGNVSAIQHFSVLLDNTAPSAPTVSLGSTYGTSLSETPIVNFSGGSDLHSGLAQIQIRIRSFSNGSTIRDWAEGVNGNPVSGLSLTNNTQYYLDISALDFAGNRSSINSSTFIIVLPITSFSYSSQNPVYPAGTAIAPNGPSVLGGLATSYSISPPLPQGLTMNPSSGVISGTPTASKKSSIHTITASNLSSSISTQLSIKITGWRIMPNLGCSGASASLFSKAFWTGTKILLLGLEYNIGVQAPCLKEYDPETQTSVDIGLPTGLSNGRYYGVVQFTGNKIIVWGGGYQSAGGWQPDTTGYEYDIATRVWTLMPNNPYYYFPVHPLVINQASAWTGSEVIIFGGVTPNCCTNTPTNRGYAYNPTNGNWRLLPTSGAPGPQFGSFSGSHQGKAYFWNNPSSGGGIYDPTLDSWSAMNGPLISQYQNGGIIPVDSGPSLYLMGGYSTANPYSKYDYQNNSWSGITAAPNGCEGYFPSANIYNNKIFIWGGVSGGDPSYTGQGCVYDIATDTWATMPSYNKPTNRTHPITVWTGDEMYLFGSGTLNSGVYVP